MSAQASSPVAMSDAVPEQQRRLLLDIVTNDSDVKESRSPNTPVLKPGHLTKGEKMALVDLAEKLVAMQKSLPKQADEARCYQVLLGDIFKSWTSKDKTDHSPALLPRKLPGMNAQVGVLKTNHPEPDDEAEKPPQQSAARLAGAPALLGMILFPEFEAMYGEGPWDEPIWEDTLWGGDIMSLSGWAFLWRDQDGHPLKHRFVKFADGVTKKDAQVRAIMEYDRNESERIITYNRERIANAARRRISKWAKDGTDGTPRVDEDDRLAESEIEKLELAFDRVQETAQLLRDISDSLFTRSLGSTLL
ncbi:hypothetical protein CEP52_004241 [Fusarium oligoseptatum]|uniref:Uncharacterized protein n=1 Tax=Fusarium oligoseptatum TaxID=2604345 RepID=A0A428U4E0_9HYPO|nr:hypothetical protein CEP52_004241 [Fusarium oligoseptatum]